MAIENLAWGTAELRDFLRLDERLYPLLPDAYREGTHLALTSALQHTPTLRSEKHQIWRALNVLSAFRFIRDHKGLPLTPETILSIFGAMLDGGAEAEWKPGSVYFETKEGFYVTLPAEQTPAAMQALCANYAFLNDPSPEQFDEIFKFALEFICIHPFRDGNGRMSVLLMQFLLQKAGLRCAVFLPLDLIQNGVCMHLTSHRIREASGVFYGMKPMDYGCFVSYVKELLAKSYQIMLDAAEQLGAVPAGNGSEHS